MFRRFFVKDSNDKRYILLYENNKLFAYLYKYQRLIILFCTLLVLCFLSIFGYNIYSVKFSSDEDIIYSESDLTFDGINKMVNVVEAGSDDLASNILAREYDTYFKRNGEVLIYKTITSKKYEIIFFTDGSALRIYDGTYLRVAPLENGDYGISEDNILDINAHYKSLGVISTSSFYGGNIIYFDDGSAYSDNILGGIFIRNSSDIYSNYISNDILCYKTSDKVYGGNSVTEFSNGVVLVTTGDKKYIVYNNSDILINDNNISYPNGNDAFVINSVKYSNDILVDYFSDGSAIINTTSNMLFLRKSNAIVTTGDKFIEIVSSNMVKISNNILLNGFNINYYTNGSAIIDFDNSSIYIYDNSSIKYNGNNVYYGDNYEKLISNDNINNQLIKKFQSVIYIDVNDNKYIVNSDNVSYFTDGSIKSFDNSANLDIGGLNISNNTDSLMHYRVVLEESDKTTLDSKYIKYMISINGSNSANYLNSNVWEIGSKLRSNKTISNTSYILYEGDVKAFSNVNVRVVLWVDYKNITNDMMNTSFVGTMKIYSSLEDL